MPLIKSSSRAAVAHNIREMVAAGHPHDQAVAAALHTADEAKDAKRAPIHRVVARLRREHAKRDASETRD